MRVVFICPCFEPGCDGVGDYIRFLAEELVATGHQIQIIALNDKYIGDRIIENSDLPIRLIRLGVQVSWKKRMHLAGEILREFSPDWVSLQFVSYGFDSHGLAFAMTSRLRAIASNQLWHIMFHEIWIYGQTVEPSIFRRILSAVQKLSISHMSKKLAFHLAHTSNESYVKKLAEVGVSAGCLPVFSNIPVCELDSDFRDFLIRKINPRLFSLNAWIFVFFGTIHPCWDFGMLLQRISAEAAVSRKKALFISIGKNTPSGDVTWRKMEACGAANCEFLKLGELSAKEISQMLGSADFGVATTPSSLLGKSGSFAAMATHGLPIIVPRYDGSPGFGASVEQSIILVDELFGKRLLHPIRPTGYLGPRDVASCWARQFESFCE
jgi:glycosyltransferase involved in cell wall biosynthesis